MMSFMIPAHGMRVFSTDGVGELISGAATVDASSALSGVVLFGATAGIAGVGRSSLLTKGFEALVETDFSQGLNAGLALTNLDEEALDLTLKLVDATGAARFTAEMNLLGRNHRALFLDQIPWKAVVVATNGSRPDLSNFVGRIIGTLDGNLAATVIQTRRGVFATLPVVPSL